MFVRVSLLALLLVAFVAGAKVSAQPIGQWRFNDDTRPVNLSQA